MNLRALTAVMLLGVAAFLPRSAAYSLYGPKWTTPTITIHLQLGVGSGVLLDGFPNWGASAEDALSLWNGHIVASRFSVVRDSTAGRGSGNGVNNAFFSSDVEGQAWGTGVLAVTLIHSQESTEDSLVETDVIFNDRVSWNSYRGPLRSASSGGTLHDFHRVALHEFGHALGLDHPDEDGQTITAIMNSRISAVDALTSDDIAGGQALYGPSGNVVTPPYITAHPASRSVVVGQSTTFTVTAGGTPPLSYRWMKSGTTLPGATHASLTLASVTLADAGSYVATVSNAGGSTTSTAATLTVTAAPGVPPPSPVATGPTILVAPASQTANAGSTVSFYVVANGTAPFSYQWLKDTVVLPGATKSALSLSNVQASHAGSYRVTVSNPAGSVTSTPAVLVVHSPPVIVTSPADQTVPIGERLRLSVVATGTSLTYAWRKDGVALAGATKSTYEIAAAEPSHNGTYTVIVSGAGGSVTSAPARIAVVAVAPTVATVPVAQTATSGESVTLNVAAKGTPPFTYQWIKDGREIPGATNETFSLSPVRAGDAGEYSVRISNRAGSITSPSAVLTVKFSRLVNLSTRAFVPAGGMLTPGFFIRGSGSKPLLIRGVGPTLRVFGIETALPEARLELIAQTGLAYVASGQDLHAISDHEAAARVGAFPLEPGAKDATLQASLAPRGYTVRVSPGDGTMAGITLAEIYDADAATSPAQLVNVSTLGFVGSGENTLAAGFVLSGNAPKRLLIRAVGPGLIPFGVAGALPDPQLALIRQGESEPRAMNDTWLDGDTMRSAFTAAGAFALPAGSNDAALIATLEPGAYTVVVSSVDGLITGQALVEIYDLDP